MAKQGIIDHLQIHGISVDLYLDKTELKFRAVVFGKVLEDHNAVELKKKIYKEVERVLNEQSNWIPVIGVEQMVPFVNENQNFIGLMVERFYVSKRNDGRWFRVGWKAEDRLLDSSHFMGAKENFSIPYISDGSVPGKLFYIEYTESKWIGLQKLVETIGDMREKLRELIGTDKGRELLEAAGSKLMLELKPKL